MDSYRAELYGISAIFVGLSHIEHIHNITSGKITIAYDNKASLEHALSKHGRVPLTSSSYDLLWAIYDIRTKLPINIKTQHVRGHRDQYTTTLDRFGQLNIYMDHRANEHRQQIENNPNITYSQMHLKHQYHIYLSNQVVTAHHFYKVQ